MLANTHKKQLRPPLPLLRAVAPRPAAGIGRDARHRDEVQRAVRHRVRVDEDVAVRGAARGRLALLERGLDVARVAHDARRRGCPVQWCEPVRDTTSPVKSFLDERGRAGQVARSNDRAATPSSRRRVDGVQVMIHGRGRRSAARFDLCTVQDAVLAESKTRFKSRRCMVIAEDT